MVSPEYGEYFGFFNLGMSSSSQIEEQTSILLSKVFQEQPILTTSGFLVLLLLATTLSLFLYIIFLHFKSYLYKNKKTRKFLLWEKILFSVIEGETNVLVLIKSIKKSDYELFGEFLAPYLKDAKGHYYEKLAQIFRDVGLMESERYQLNHSIFDWRRALAAQRLGTVKPVEAINDLIKALYYPETGVSLNAAGALLKIGEPYLAKKAVLALLQNDQLTEELFVEILLSYGESISLKALIDMNLNKVKTFSRLEIIDLIGYYFRVEEIPILIKRLNETTDYEETIHLIKALGNLGSEESMPYLITFLKSKSSVIRAQAAKALGTLKDERTLLPLSKILEDKNWWCRYHSTSSIYQLGGNGKKFLRNYLDETEDKFAQDMIVQFLFEPQ